METLQTAYAGLTLRNPLIVASSGLTNNIDKIKDLEKAGTGAVVLKSLFEEQILDQAHHVLYHSADYPEAYDYVQNYVRSHRIEEYLTLIREAKVSCSIPIIASINCYDNGSWVSFARDMEAAGADAIEINILKIATVLDEKPGEYEKLHTDILKAIKNAVKIPVTVKMGQRFSNIVAVVNQLKANNADGVVLFNRFYQPDIDIHKMQFTSGTVFSSSSDFSNTMRWIGIVSGQIPNLSLAASTGVHEPEAVIKALLAGASAVELCSVLYQHGNGIIMQMLTILEEWMQSQGFKTIGEFKGLLNFKNVPDQSYYERVQFMKYFSNRD